MNKTISIGMIITCLGLLVTSGGTWFGLSLQGINSLVAFFIAAIVLLGGGIAVFMGVRAKVCTSDFAKWMGIEIGCLVVMFCVFGFSVLPTATTFNFIRNHTALSEAANTDINGIQNMLNEFDTNETARMEATFNGLQNYLRLGNRNCSPQLASYIQNSLGSAPQFFSQSIINNNRGTVEARISDLRLGNRMYRNTFNNVIEQLRGEASSRVPLHYSKLNQQMDTVSANVGQVLTEISASLDLPVVAAGHGNQYTIRNTRATTYSFRPEAFAREYEQSFQFNWTSIIMAAVSALAAMFYYFISYRSLRKGVEKGSKISDNLGLPL